MRDLGELRAQFADASVFGHSPLYRELAPLVSQDERLLRLAAHARKGQYPVFLFFGAVHFLVLGGAGASRYPRPETLASFCLEHEAELRRLLETRLVQTNAVPRSLALRLGLAALRSRVEAVHVVEVGASAGLNLRCDRFGYRLGGRQFGETGSSVQIESEIAGGPVPDLDAAVPIASATGIDLNPLDSRLPEDRRWLRALVPPDTERERALLDAALEVVAADPPRIVAGHAADVAPRLDRELPAGEPRLAFVVATRMHVPEEEHAAFDAAIRVLGGRAPLYVLSLERVPDPDPRPQPAPPGGGLYLAAPDGSETLLAVTAPRLDWIAPV